MKRALSTLSLILFISWLSIGQSFALFGNECKRPKSLYESYLSSSKKLQIQESNARIRAEELAKSEYARCRKNPKQFLDEKKLDLKVYPRVKSSCVWWKIAYGGVTSYLGQKTAYDEYRNAMLIVSNYKKCFDPEVFISAKDWLQANPKK